MEEKEPNNNNISYPDMLNNILTETINTQDYIRTLVNLTLPKDKLEEFEFEFIRQRDAIREQYVPKK